MGSPCLPVCNCRAMAIWMMMFSLLAVALSNLWPLKVALLLCPLMMAGSTHMDMSPPSADDLECYPHVIFILDNAWDLGSIAFSVFWVRCEVHHVATLMESKFTEAMILGRYLWSSSLCWLLLAVCSWNLCALPWPSLWSHSTRRPLSVQCSAFVDLGLLTVLSSLHKWLLCCQCSWTAWNSCFWYVILPAHDKGILGHGGATVFQVQCGKDIQLTCDYLITSQHERCTTRFKIAFAKTVYLMISSLTMPRLRLERMFSRSWGCTAMPSSSMNRITSIRIMLSARFGKSRKLWMLYQNDHRELDTSNELPEIEVKRF